MGLAASQARFLGITARKANCEFKSTRLAQERLQLTDQLTAASQEYAAALNSTKLVWKNDACTQDYRVNYNLLMTPSAANDYNPYFVTTKSGALILDSKYIAAAEAAGITISGGVASQENRDKFIAALVPTGLITQETADAITITNYKYEIDDKKKDLLKVKDTEEGSETDAKLDIQGIFWEEKAGLGKEPLSTTVYDSLTLADLIMDKNIGKQKVDWLQLYKSLANEGVKDGNFYVTEQEYNSQITMYEQNTSNAIASFISMKDPADSTQPLYKAIDSSLDPENISEEVTQMVNGFKDAITDKNQNPSNNIGDKVLAALYDAYSMMNQSGLSKSQQDTYRQRYNNLVNGINASGEQLDTSGNVLKVGGLTKTQILNLTDKAQKDSLMAEYERQVQISQLYFGIRAAALEEQMYKDGTGTRILKWDDKKNEAEGTGNGGGNLSNNTTNTKTLTYNDVFGLNNNLEEDHDGHEISYTDKDGNTKSYRMYDIDVIKDGIIQSSPEDITSISIANLLKDDVVLYAKNNNGSSGDSIKNIRNAAKAILEYVAKALGYGQIGVGINTDEATNSALYTALMMTEKIYLNANNAVIGGEGEAESSNDKLYNDQAYNNAVSYNRIGAHEKKTDAAVSLSNMVAAFLTYYDNALRGAESPYVVGRGNDSTDNSKTYFVTSDPNYTYVAIPEEQIEYNERMSNFYDELYNNLCAYGYRRDDMVQDDEYLQSAIKDGRYALMSLNLDGYYYQTRYADTGYLVEEKDQDAITKAEAEYTQKKAQITYKEEVLDMRTKNLDAEIAALNAEMNSVQNMITKSIEKTFQMFQGGS